MLVNSNLKAIILNHFLLLARDCKSCVCIWREVRYSDLNPYSSGQQRLTDFTTQGTHEKI